MTKTAKRSSSTAKKMVKTIKMKTTRATTKKAKRANKASLRSALKKSELDRFASD